MFVRGWNPLCASVGTFPDRSADGLKRKRVEDGITLNACFGLLAPRFSLLLLVTWFVSVSSLCPSFFYVCLSTHTQTHLCILKTAEARQRPHPDQSGSAYLTPLYLSLTLLVHPTFLKIGGGSDLVTGSEGE